MTLTLVSFQQDLRGQADCEAVELALEAKEEDREGDVTEEEEEEEEEEVEGSRSFVGRLKYQYKGKNSEGNRFILDGDL